MLIQIDFRGHEPIYAQIVRQITRLVQTGQLEPNDRLPTMRQLAAELGVNFNTVARAYGLLDQQGIISTQQGRGTYILPPPGPPDQKRHRRAQLTALASQFVAEASRLGYSPKEIRAGVQAALRAARPSGKSRPAARRLEK